MTVQPNNLPSGSINSEGDFVNLGIHLDDIDFWANGRINKERIEDLRAASAKLSTSASPVYASIGGIVGIGTVHLLPHSLNAGLFDFTVDGMRGELAQQMGEGTLKIYGGGPHLLNQHRLAELEDKARKIKTFFFGENVRLKLESCSVVLYAHINPDSSDADSTSNILLDFRDGQISRTEGSYAPLIVPDRGEAWPSYLFGSESDGRQVGFFGSPGAGTRVMVSVFHQALLPPSKCASYAELRTSARYQEERGITGVELIFHRPFIDLIARASSAQDTEPNLPRLLQKLVHATLGDGSLPHPFFRVGTLASMDTPDFLRENSAPWESVRRAFLEAVAVSEQSAGAEANHS